MEERTMNLRNARAELVVFLALTFGLSAVWYWLLISAGGMAHERRYVTALMWSPAIGALLSRLVFHRTLRGLGWGWPGLRWAALAYALPLAYSSVAYGSVLLFGLGAVDLTRAPDDVLRFVVVGTLQSMLLATGEEIGWRGYLVPVLARTLPFGRLVVVSGVIWAGWHVPLVAFADYHASTPTWYSMLCFTASVIAISLPMAWLRLRSRSVWPAALLHASHNLYLQGFFDRITVDTGLTRWFAGEFGVALVMTTCVTAWLVQRSARHSGSLARVLSDSSARSERAGALTPGESHEIPCTVVRCDCACRMRDVQANQGAECHDGLRRQMREFNDGGVL